MPDYDWGILAFCLAVTAAILGIYLRIAVRMWECFMLPWSLARLAALSICVAFVWYIIALVIVLPFGLSPHAAHVLEYVDIIFHTIGLPWIVARFIYSLPNLPQLLGPRSNDIYG